GQWALHLGEQPREVDDEVSSLSVAVAPLSDGEFYHFGTTSDVIESVYQLQTIERDQTRLGPSPSFGQPCQFIQDSDCGVPVRRQENERLWIENSHVPPSWTLHRRHMITNVPRNDWTLELAEGTCLDFVPIADDLLACRIYGYGDAFRGRLNDSQTRWMERPAAEWFERRGIRWENAQLDPTSDLQEAAIFAALPSEAWSGEFVQWLIGQGATNETYCRQWTAARRFSARDLAREANLERTYAQRMQFRQEAVPLMARHGAQSVFYKLDLDAAARTFATSDNALDDLQSPADDVLLGVHCCMFRSAVRRLRGDDAWDDEEKLAFLLLEKSIVAPYQRHPVQPTCRLAEDQIVWARSPLRIDLAGGWTDIPPYCLEHGGQVVNLAVNLNGQPPIQAFARRSPERSITLRSIDLGLRQELRTYEEIGDYRGIGGGFSVAKAALALCGFHPRFNGQAYASLAEQLEDFGGGVELSMVAAVPKGSGMGASSILAGATLAAIAELCELGWDRREITYRVSAVEQMLGSGGGWQDQFGGLEPGAKLIETEPGLSQHASVRWLPIEFFTNHALASRTLLYYTGIARTAHDVLREIVRGMFLNDPHRLDLLRQIGDNAKACFDAVQRADAQCYASSLAQSWRLNQRLDSGTSPPAVADVVDRVAPFAEAFKLAGAGGGGFLYILARDDDAADRLRHDLLENPPNDRARFLSMEPSTTGLEVTRS
ncbi:MAG: hypothetical protein KDA61_10075, partial [Planctomycetales bacterium]|nr:hypothetical protein [Planctomycetales bacterium]